MHAPDAEHLSPRLLLVQSVHAGPQFCASRVVQLAPRQQPVGHEVASHTHEPALHR